MAIPKMNNMRIIFVLLSMIFLISCKSNRKNINDIECNFTRINTEYKDTLLINGVQYIIGKSSYCEILNDTINKFKENLIRTIIKPCCKEVKDLLKSTNSYESISLVCFEDTLVGVKYVLNNSNIKEKYKYYQLKFKEPKIKSSYDIKLDTISLNSNNYYKIKYFLKSKKNMLNFGCW